MRSASVCDKDGIGRTGTFRHVGEAHKAYRIYRNLGLGKEAVKKRGLAVQYD
jgi:hypothetical protein